MNFKVKSTKNRECIKKRNQVKDDEGSKVENLKVVKEERLTQRSSIKMSATSSSQLSLKSPMSRVYVEARSTPRDDAVTYEARKIVNFNTDFLKAKKDEIMQETEQKA